MVEKLMVFLHDSGGCSGPGSSGSDLFLLLAAIEYSTVEYTVHLRDGKLLASRRGHSRQTYQVLCLGIAGVLVVVHDRLEDIKFS